MNKQRGFTVLELLVVLAVLGIVLALVGVKMGTSLDEAKETRIEADLSVLIAAGEAYAQQHPGVTAEGQAALMDAGVLSAVVTSPVEGYRYHVTVSRGMVKAYLMKGEAVYEQGGYRAEKTSTRLYLD